MGESGASSGTVVVCATEECGRSRTTCRVHSLENNVCSNCHESETCRALFIFDKIALSGGRTSTGDVGREVFVLMFAHVPAMGERAFVVQASSSVLGGRGGNSGFRCVS